jgi:plasmid stabilization system protein ParE
MRTVISRLAEDDLARIYGNIAANDPEAAERFQTEATKALALLGEHPGLGPRPGWKTRHRRLRFWVISRFHNYLIFYETGEDKCRSSGCWMDAARCGASLRKASKASNEPAAAERL